LCFGIDRHRIAPLEPSSTRLFERRLTTCSGISGQAFEVVVQSLFDEQRRGVLGLANAQADRAVSGRGRDGGKKLAQPLKRVGLQFFKQRIHGRDYRGLRWPCAVASPQTMRLTCKPRWRWSPSCGTLMAMRFSDLRFLLALVLPALSGIGLIIAPQNAFVSTLIVWASFALLECVMPKNSPLPIESDASLSYFRWILRAYVVLQIGLIMLGAWAAAHAHWLLVLGIAFSVGYISGSQGITFAHELGHSKSKIDRFCGWLLMTSVCYGHFMVEHYRGHHPRAATYDDPASARYGESLYAFLPRTLWGSLASGWRLEAQRLVQMKSTWAKSPLLWSTLASLSLIFMPFLMLFSPIAGIESAQTAMKLVVFFLLQSVVAFALLEMVNYIEHYGLQRKTEGNKREAFGKMHAWNADHVLTNSLLVNLQRHSDHHMHAWKPYGTLQDMPETPRLPTGYAGSIVLAAIPPLWFALMHPKLEALRSAT
jgi:alkane 1-monooxygenase